MSTIPNNIISNISNVSNGFCIGLLNARSSSDIISYCKVIISHNLKLSHMNYLVKNIYKIIYR